AEALLVAGLRRRLQAKLELEAGGSSWLHARWLEDGELLRFVRARRQNLAEAEGLFEKAAAWRRKYAECWALDTSVTGSFGSTQAKYLRALQGDGAPPPAWWAFLHAKLPLHTCGKDRYGLPVVYNALGCCDLQGCVREVGFEAVLRYVILQNDHFLDLARQATLELDDARVQGNRQVLHGGIVILDLEGFSWRRLGDVKTFNEISAVVKLLHPERQRRLFVVRAPRAFSSVWKLIRPLIDPRTVAKISISGAQDALPPDLWDELGVENVPQQQQLQQQQQQQLPQFLGGQFSGLELKGPSGFQRVEQGAFARFQASR
ncbi:unnamed protein product, partial [Polarella glacialis]